MEEREVFFEMEGEEHCIEEAALAELLDNDVVFCNERHYTFAGEPSGCTTILFVNANDVFAWGCADAQDLPHSEIGNLYKAHKEKWGVTKWLCRQRQEKPQPPIVRDMKKDGAWDDEMEALPDNTTDRYLKAKLAEAVLEGKLES